MKKQIIFITTILISVIMLTGCGKQADDHKLYTEENLDIEKNETTSEKTTQQEETIKGNNNETNAEEKEKITKHTITFDSKEGSSVANQTVNSGSKVKKPSNPTKTGYTFKEWQLNGNTYNFDTAVKSDITLAAIWIEKIVTYTITFDSNGGSSIATQTVNSGSKVKKPSNPTKTGYTFKEWQLNGNTYNFDTAVKSNITLTAVWEEKQYEKPTTPTLRGRGGGGPTFQEVSLAICYNSKCLVDDEVITGIDGWELYSVNNGNYTLLSTYGANSFSEVYHVDNQETMSFIARVFIINGTTKVYSNYSNIYLLKN